MIDLRPYCTPDPGNDFEFRHVPDCDGSCGMRGRGQHG